MKVLRKAAGYLRMSSNKQDKSIASQKAEVQKLAAREGYQVVRWYVDEAMSGDDETRPAWNELLKDIQTVRGFEAIVCWAQDRTSRADDLTAAVEWKILRDNEVKMHTVVEGLTDFNDFISRLKATFNQNESNGLLVKIANNVSRTAKTITEEGYWASGWAPFGYRLGPATRNPTRKQLFVDQGQGPVVVEIFNRYLNRDESMREIARWLNKRGLLTKFNNPWCGDNVKDLLRNEVYLGHIVRGKWASGKHIRLVGGEFTAAPRKLPGHKRAKTLVQRREDCLIAENAHEALVDKATFAAVQLKLTENKEQKRKPRQRCGRLSGLVVCGHCGKKLGGNTTYNEKTGKAYEFYFCTSRNSPSGAKPECRATVKRDEVTEKVLRWIEGYHLSDECIEIYRDLVSKALHKQRSGRAEAEARSRTTLEDCDKKLAKAEKRLLEVDDDMVPAITRQIRELRAKQLQAKAELAAAETMGFTSEKAIAEEANRIVTEMRQLRIQIRHDDPAIARAALMKILDRVEVFTVPVTERPAGMSNSQKRVLHSIKVIYRDDKEKQRKAVPSFLTTKECGATTLDCQKQINAVKQADNQTSA